MTTVGYNIYLQTCTGEQEIRDLIGYTQEQNCGQLDVPSWSLFSLACVVVRRRVFPLLNQLVALLTDGIQPFVLQGRWGEEREI